MSSQPATKQQAYHELPVEVPLGHEEAEPPQQSQGYPCMPQFVPSLQLGEADTYWTVRSTGRSGSVTLPAARMSATFPIRAMKPRRLVVVASLTPNACV